MPGSAGAHDKYGKMLVKQNHLTQEDYQVIADGLERIRVNRGVEQLDVQCIDLYANLIKWLYEEVGGGERLPSARWTKP